MQRTITRTTKKAVEAEMRRLGHMVDQGTYVRPWDGLVPELIAGYLANGADQWEANTKLSYANALAPAPARVRTSGMAGGILDRSGGDGPSRDCSATAAGRGYGSAAQRLLVRYLFAHTQVNRVDAITDITNVGEQRALEKAGFTRAGSCVAPRTVPGGGMTR
jgi:hypothetical protein